MNAVRANPVIVTTVAYAVAVLVTNLVILVLAPEPGAFVAVNVGGSIVLTAVAVGVQGRTTPVDPETGEPLNPAYRKVRG